MASARLLRDYRTRYHDPVGFARGETVTVGKRDDEWPQYFWAIDVRGRNGWVHQRFLEATSGVTRAARDYTACELDADAGETVRLLEEAGGWWWCENSAGAQGWLPARDLETETETTP